MHPAQRGASRKSGLFCVLGVKPRGAGWRYMIFWAQMRMDPHQEAKRVGLPEGYGLEAAGNNLLLKRPNGYLIAAFGEGVRPTSIRSVAEADERYLRAVEREERFGSGADSETVLLFAEDVKEARSEFLLALEAAYRG